MAAAKKTTKKTAAKKTVKKSAAPKANAKSATPTPVKKAAKKAPAKKAAKKTAAAPAKKSTEKKVEGLGKPQVRILEALKKFGPLTRAQISNKTEITSGFTSYLGHNDPEKREPRSLAAQGMLTVETHDIDNRDTTVYVISKKGEAAIS